MQDVFQDMLYKNLLMWVDDIVIFAKTVEELLDVIRKFSARLREYGLKLNTKKSGLFARQISWCGRLIAGEGVRHDPERVAALSSLPLPSTAAALQKLLCASNWLRESIVNPAQHAAPLQAKLEAASDGHSRKQRYAEVCVTTDASDRELSLIVSQVDNWDDAKHLTEQTHELILCKGGMFESAQPSWSIAKKKGLSDYSSSKRLGVFAASSNRVQAVL
ncbi:unnamed protein product [Phytophthora lilii]|uniref:Unnamed protein product n=1 Tax=Phytophthora lilii TaxID=2077276 RepID=A0A9W7D7A9_9STRA|nr:unnamed protein product [Phytophthora lilii]